MGDGEYILLYPALKEKSRITLYCMTELYIEAIGKTYQRITLFVCVLENFLS